MSGKQNRKAIAPIISILLLIVIAIASAIVVYGFITGSLAEYTPSKPQGIYKKIVIEGYTRQGNLLTIYVRNVGSASVTVSSVYLDTPQKGQAIKLPFAVFQSSTEIWGGDIWQLNYNNFKIELKQPGKILYDTFTSEDPSTWDDEYINYNNEWNRVYYDPNGLKLLSESDDGWAVRGLITIDKIIDLREVPIVIEVDLQKTSYNVPNGDAAASPFAACLYLSSSKNQNPYYATPWFAVKLYPRSFPYRTEAQLVTRNSGGTIKTKILYTWSSARDTQPRGVFLLVFNESNKVYYYFWSDSRSGDPYTSGSWSSTGLEQVFNDGMHYIYLTIDNRVTVSSRKVHVRYLQIYRGTSISIVNLKKDWFVKVVEEDNPSEVIFEGAANSTALQVDLLNYIIDSGMPLRGSILVFTYDPQEVEKYGGIVVPPGEVKSISLSLSSDFHGVYVLTLVDVSGGEVSQSIEI